MKKIIIMALAVAGILLLAGCVGTGAPGYNGNVPPVRENGSVQNTDLPPSFPEEDEGTTTDPDMPPPLPE